MATKGTFFGAVTRVQKCTKSLGGKLTSASVNGVVSDAQVTSCTFTNNHCNTLLSAGNTNTFNRVRLTKEKTTPHLAAFPSIPVSFRKYSNRLLPFKAYLSGIYQLWAWSLLDILLFCLLNLSIFEYHWVTAPFMKNFKGLKVSYYLMAFLHSVCC